MLDSFLTGELSLLKLGYTFGKEKKHKQVCHFPFKVTLKKK